MAFILPDLLVGKRTEGMGTRAADVIAFRKEVEAMR
jgi:hypothetical protein